jgi:hypothetical protein
VLVSAQLLKGGRVLMVTGSSGLISTQIALVWSESDLMNLTERERGRVKAREREKRESERFFPSQTEPLLSHGSLHCSLHLALSRSLHGVVCVGLHGPTRWNNGP